MPDFTGSHKKIERSKKHIDDLAGTLKSFAGSDFYTVSVEKHPGEGVNYLFIGQKISSYDVLTTCALIIGDVLHNLRSALDLLYYQTVGWCGGKNDNRTKFPISETRQILAGMVNGALVQNQITQTVHDFILNTIKPYEAGNRSLWGLHKLNIVDKHQLLIPTFQMMGFTEIRLENEEGLVREIPPFLTEIPMSRRLNDWLPGCHTMVFKVKDKGNAATGIQFQRGFPLEGESVFAALNGIAEEVTRTVEAFEQLLP